ncbi:hypothetical protein [Haladaptatus sp. DYSN1]|uniref:hypothetical protein n=1 Tax=unclassified Haladaptatus TaxID=2622732 RepID=UPI002407570B|nr:hypothetical protein [Haladaptatus sp. DYSN1]
MKLRHRLGISKHRQRQLTRLMEILLVGMFFIGLERRNGGIMVNTAVALLVVQLPPLLERDYNIPMDAGLTLWITSAVFLHALGTVGIPGTGIESFYRYTGTWWWDHLTHALSSSIVAAVGYATARAIDEHSDNITLPPKFMFVYILLFVLAFGVFWEVIEFTLDQTARMLGVGGVLTQYGLEDTMLDLIFDTIGAVVVAIWGTAHLTGVVDAVRVRLDSRTTD